MSRVIKHELSSGRGGLGTGQTDGEEVAVFGEWIPKKTGNWAHEGYFCLHYVSSGLNHLGFLILGK